jgi:hypothetical protein
MQTLIRKAPHGEFAVREGLFGSTSVKLPDVMPDC